MTRRKPGEEFEFYIEEELFLLRQYLLRHFEKLEVNNEGHKREFNKLNERLNKMATLAEELGVEETTLSEVVPALATEVTDFHNALTAKEENLNLDAATIAQDSAEFTANKAELAAIKQVKENLAPLVEKAKALIPAPAVPVGTEPITTTPAPAPEVAPVSPPVEQFPVNPTPPVEQEHPAEPAPEVPAPPVA